MIVFSTIDRPAWNNGIWKEVEQKYDTARRSLDQSKVVISWDARAGTPSRLPEGAPLYYHPSDPPEDTRAYAGDILTALDTSEWTETPST